MRFSLRKKEKKCSSACCVTGGRNGGNPLGMIVAAESAVEDGAGMQERTDRLIGPSQEADRLMSVAAGDWPRVRSSCTEGCLPWPRPIRWAINQPLPPIFPA